MATKTSITSHARRLGLDGRGYLASLARRLLRWEPKVKFMDGLHQTIEWYFSTKDREMVGAALAGRLTER